MLFEAFLNTTKYSDVNKHIDQIKLSLLALLLALEVVNFGTGAHEFPMFPGSSGAGTTFSVISPDFFLFACPPAGSTHLVLAPPIYGKPKKPSVSCTTCPP